MPPAVWKGSPAEQNQWFFAHAGTWPDLVRSSSAGVTREDVREFNRPVWHYVNLPVFLTPAHKASLLPTLTNNRATTPPRDPADRDQNVIQAISSSRAVLADDSRTRADRAVALAWLLHLVADSHQPMHSAALFSPHRFLQGDRGGNSIPVRGADGDLHGLWDASILPRRAEYNRVRREALELVEQHAEAGKIAARELTPKAWLVESWKLAEKQAYGAAIRDAVAAAETGGDLVRIQLAPDYLKAAGVASKRRAAKAGYRIAAMLAGRLPSAQSVPAPPNAGPQRASSLTPTGSNPESNLAHQFWLNIKTNVRHNWSCRNYENTSAGRHCSADEGTACEICGG